MKQSQYKNDNISWKEDLGILEFALKKNAFFEVAIRWWDFFVPVVADDMIKDLSIIR